MRAADRWRWGWRPGVRGASPLLVWFTVICVAYYYKPVVCGGVAHGLGATDVCDASVRGISTNHWAETILYCPLMWFGLHRVKQEVFDGQRVLRRRELVADFGIALMLYGFGLHIANVIELYSRRSAGISTGRVYDLTYFIDEDLSHYVIQLSLFFVLGWLIIHDRPDRTEGPTLALIVGVVHGVERGISFVEAGKWFLVVPVLAWFALAIFLRWRRHGGDWQRCSGDFFFRYAVSFSLLLPVTIAWYRLTFHSFTQPSHLPRPDDPLLAVGMIVLTAIGFVVSYTASNALVGGRRPAPSASPATLPATSPDPG